MSNYWQKKMNELNKSNAKTTSVNSVGKTASGNYWQNKMNELEAKNSIAPVRPTSTNKKKKDKKFDFFQSGAFEDGYQFGDIGLTVGSTIGDAAINATKGVGNMVEGIVDLGAYGIAGMIDLSNKLVGGDGKTETAADMRKRYQKNVVDDFLAPIDEALNENSVLGRTSDSVMQGLGQIGAVILTGGAAGAAGMSATAATTGTMFLSGTGSGMTEAYQSGANDLQALKHGLNTGAADAVSELIFGGLGKGFKALGFSKGLSSADDMLAKLVGSKFKNQAAKNIVEFGIKSGAEGLEEVLAGVAQAYSKYHNYLKEDGVEFIDVLKDENLLEQFLVGTFASGVAQSSSLIRANTHKNEVTGEKEVTDFITGFTETEQAVIDKEVEKLIAEQEKDGRKLTKKEKQTITEQVEEGLDKGYISIDTIAEVLGGEDYTKHKELTKDESALRSEYAMLRSMRNGDKSTELEERQAELSKLIPTFNESKTNLHTKVFEGVRGSRLTASYGEELRKGQKFTADTSKYSEKQAAMVQRAIDSGVLNNTNRSHEFVDTLAKIEEGKGLTIHLTNNKQLKASGRLKSGATTNGWIDGDGNLVVNVDSAKALNSVVGHELTHTLEDSDSYKALRDTAFAHAEERGEYRSRLKSIKDLYSKHDANADPFKELTADLVGDYVFTDEKFIERLLNDDRSTFSKVMDEIKYLARVATAGSKEARELEKVKHQFEKAWKNSDKAQVEGTKNSLSDSDGNRLTNEQTEYFKDSVARDENGNLLTVYHTTNNDFTVFDKSRQGEATQDGNTYMGFFFSDDAEYLQNFPEFQNGKTDAYYLNIKKPIDMTNVSKEAFLDVVEVLGGDVTEAAEVFDEEGGGQLVSLLDSLVGDVDYNTFVEELKPHYSELTAKGYDGVINYLSEGYGVKEYIVLDSKQAKLTSNTSPTADADIRYSLTSELDGEQIDPARFSVNESDTQYSLSFAKEIADGQNKWIAKNQSKAFVDTEELAEAQRVTAAMVDVMMQYSNILPEDKIGKVITKNGSYDRSIENTTICVRTLAYNEFVDKVQEQLGRPLTQMESFLVSQKLYDIATEPQCLYCYVSLDRKAYNDMLLRYMSDRDEVIAKYNSSDKSSAAIEALYEEFLHGRKPTKEMRSRFNNWIGYVDNGTQLLSLADIATEASQANINALGGALAAQLKDARKYAQSASWAKIQKDYVAYRDEILKLGDKVVKDLNSHYGMRWYSFSDFSAAFIVENMQQITDASIRGLKGLSYTKDTDFAEIFAPTGMNINISVFVNQDADGNYFIDEKQSASFEDAKRLREQYPNVGIVATVTNDDALKWAASQEWSDVIIPFHIVRTGTDVAEYYKWLNYTSESGDTVSDKSLWDAYVDSLNPKSESARKKVSKNIYPNEHKNDKTTYLTLCENRGLTPRFARFAGESWYMKLVNETRLSSEQSVPLRPIFNEDAAKASFDKFVKKGGYEGGWYLDGVDVDAEAAIVADDVRAGRKANEVEYGRQDGFVPEAIMARRKKVRTHGRYSLSDDTAPVYGSYNIRGRDVAYSEDIAPVDDGLVYDNESADVDVMQDAEVTPVQQSAQQSMTAEKQQPAQQTTAQKFAPVREDKPYTFADRVIGQTVDKGMPVENLSYETGNHALQDKYNYMLPGNTKARAEYFMEHGENGVASFKNVLNEVNKAGKKKDFFRYLEHALNVDRMTLDVRFGGMNKPVFGDHVTADISRSTVEEYEKNNPKFKKWAEEIYSINGHLRNMLVDEGILTQEAADRMQEMYPHYVPIVREGLEEGTYPLETNSTGVNSPIKRATGGNAKIQDIDKSIAQRIEQTFRAVARNSFGIELRNTLRTNSVVQQNEADVDEMLDLIDNQDSLLNAGVVSGKPTFTVFENGQRVEFDITEALYDSLKPADKVLAHRYKPLTTVSGWRRNLITTLNPVFALYRNPIKDLQDMAINSQHAVKTYANVPNAVWQLATNGKYAEEYHKHGGKGGNFFDSQKNEFNEDTLLTKMYGKLTYAGEFIEEIPRLAEYIASRQEGRTIERSMLDAARVTTNFAAGGDFTKFLNAHGFTFLNASVQGASQHVRNFREAKAEEGLKGVTKTLAKYVIAGLPAYLLNGMLWEDDEEYEELSDYVKQNYYVVKKTKDGKFIRIPKGRTVAVMSELMNQMENLVTGDDVADFSTFFDLFWDNMAPSNPLENNILAPVFDVLENEAWYGDELVPSRLQDLPAEEQFDESTDIISKKIGEKFGISPYKLNYLLDQYSGGVGDMILPMLTPEAESGDNSFKGNLIAPWKKEMTTDSVLNNKYPGEFYDLKDELKVKANSSKATDEDILRSMYMSSVSSEMGALYGKKREIQNSNMTDAQKFKEVRKVQEQINAIAKRGLNSYENINIDGKYATIGDRRFDYSDYSDRWYEIEGEYLEREQAAIDRYGITPSEYWNDTDLYYNADYFFKYKQEMEDVAKMVYGGKKFAPYAADLGDISADKDTKTGKTISGSKKKKIINYINSQSNLDYGEKIIMLKMNYPADDSYNYDIIDYLNNRSDIGYSEMVTILESLDMKVSADGTVTWK